MITKATLNIKGIDYNILQMQYHFHRNTDIKGRPTTGVLGGDIKVKLELGKNTALLETMILQKMSPINGFIKLTDIENGGMIRELKFEESYLYHYGENANTTGSEPMTTWISISPTRLDINKMIRIDRRISTTPGFWWEEYEEEKPTTIIKTDSEPSKPTILVTSVKGADTALPFQVMKYTVTGYNQSDVSENDRKRVKWVVEINEKKEVQNGTGEVLDLFIKEEWAGKEIAVMPYLKQETKKVSAITIVKKRIVTLFIGGAADKNSYYAINPTKLIKDGATTPYLNWVKSVKSIEHYTLYLGYEEVFRDEHVAGLCTYIGSTKTPVYIIGHSLGGWNGAHLSQILTDKGFHIEMLITLDPVGKGAMVWAASDIHYEIPTPKADFWINISAMPDKDDSSDVVADFGERWIPETGPDVNYISKAHHGEVRQMFNENIYQGKSAFQLLKECITKE